MKQRIFIAAVVAVICSFAATDLAVLAGRGRGGGGGGGRAGGGGGARPAPSRPAVGSGVCAGGARPGPAPAPRPSPSPGVGAKVGGGPSVGGGPKVGGGPSVGGGPKGGSGFGPAVGAGVGAGIGAGVSQGALNDFFNGPGGGKAGSPAIGQGPGKVGDGKLAGTGKVGDGKVGEGKVGTKAGQQAANRPIANNRPERVENRQQLAQNRTDRRQQIRNEFNDNHPRWDFATDHPRWANWRINAPWRWATAGALLGWGGYGAESYYDYGENIYYQDGAVYSDGQQIATADQYATAAEQIATSIPQVQNPDWLTLGVFAITQDGEKSGPAPTMFVQINVSKEGVISGTFQNTVAGTVQPVEGMVDKQSQRAAWLVSGKTRPIMETGIFNLTKDTAPALVHFADGQTQQLLLVRLDEPKK